MSSPYDLHSAEIKRLIREGASQEEVLESLTTNHPQLVSQAAQLLKHIQAVERELRQYGR